MSRCFIRGSILKPFLRQPTVKLFIVLLVSSCWIYASWDPYENEQVSDNFVDKAMYDVAQDPRLAVVYRKKAHLPKDLKYILLWTREDYAPFYQIGPGQRAFITNNCSFTNCYVTADRNFFNGDLTNFDAIAFNGRNLNYETLDELPQQRSPHQKYIYFNTESADNYPVCNKIFDGFFNWTATYRLDSDIVYNYILIRNKTGQIVGPKLNMEWVENMQEIDENQTRRLAGKVRAAAWFVSHCSTVGGREKFVRKLKRALIPYGLNVDIYGSCGSLRCPLKQQNVCHAKIEKTYHFYMALENSLNEDYVTEKLLIALQNNLVPIVYAGANLTRYLPPGSYIDGRAMNASALASLMNSLFISEKLYKQYFKWKNHYTYHNSAPENVCRVCQALNDKERVDTLSQYKRFRRWWNPHYLRHCTSWFNNFFGKTGKPEV